ncbi:MAG: hypothetical protein C0408_06670, partial [Odoribacter sp.]|nr:hypothetical protein [Odoribacter sp.]
MKKSVYKSGLLLSSAAIFLLSFTLTAQEIKKEFHKEYKAGTATTLDINNRYGDVTIQSWDKDHVVIDVKVSIDMPDRSRAEKMMSYIDIQFNESENLITAKTVIDDKFNFSGWGLGSRKFTIDYNVKMPAGTNLNLTNKYGNSDIDELHGLVTINIKYGDLIAGKLSRGNEKPLNKLSLAYGKASIDVAGWLDIYARYSNSLEIVKSQALLIDSRYSKIRLGETSSVVGETKYGDVGADKINNLVLVTGYTSVNVGELTKKLILEGSYGSLSVEKIPAGFESLEVDVRYMGVRLGIDESASYNLKAHASYGGIKF